MNRKFKKLKLIFVQPDNDEMNNKLTKSTLPVIYKRLSKELAGGKNISHEHIHFLLASVYLLHKDDELSLPQDLINQLVDQALSIFNDESDAISTFISENGNANLYSFPKAIIEAQNWAESIKDLHYALMDLRLEQRKLIFFSTAGYDPTLICESLAYDNQNQYWENKEIAYSELKKRLRQGIKNIEVSELHKLLQDLLERYMEASDEVDNSLEAHSGKSNIMLLSLSVIIILLASWIFIWPIANQPDGEELFSQYFISSDAFEQLYSDSVLTRKDIETGLTDEQASSLLKDIEDEKLTSEEYSADQLWLECLLNIKRETYNSARQLLRDLQSYDNAFYKQYARGLMWKIRITGD